MADTIPATVADVPQVSTWSPPGWANSLMARLLKTPGVERWVGSAIALITFKGRKSGKTYTTPITYLRSGNEVILLTKRFRVWWRNLLDVPKVSLRLAGRNVRGLAEVVDNEDEALPIFINFLKERPRDARAYGLSFDADGSIDLARARSILPQIVVLRIRLVEPDDAGD